MSFRWKEKNVKSRRDCNVKKKIHVRSKENVFGWDRRLCWASGSGGGKVGGSRKKFSRGRKESRRTSETPLGTWLDKSQKGSLWLCYAGPLAEKRKSEI